MNERAPCSACASRPRRVQERLIGRQDAFNPVKDGVSKVKEAAIVRQDALNPVKEADIVRQDAFNPVKDGAPQVKEAAILVKEAFPKVKDGHPDVQDGRRVGRGEGFQVVKGSGVCGQRLHFDWQRIGVLDGCSSSQTSDSHWRSIVGVARVPSGPEGAASRGLAMRSVMENLPKDS